MLLERCLELLNIYYSYQVFNENSSSLIFCDIDDPALVSLRLAVIGESLVGHQLFILNRLLRDVPKFQTILFAKIKPHKLYDAFVDQYNIARSERPPTQESRRGILSRVLLLEAYRAEHQFRYLLAPIWQWCSYACSCLEDQSIWTDLHRSAIGAFIYSTFNKDDLPLSGTSILEPFLRALNREEILDACLKVGCLPSLLNAAVS
jgi:hypothetical protein